MRKLIKNLVLLIFLIGVCQITYSQEGNYSHRGYGTGSIRSSLKYTYNTGTSSITATNALKSDLKEIQIYPNPTTDFCFLTINRPLSINQKAELHSADGKLLSSINIISSETKIKLSEYPSGAYYIRVIGGNSNTETFKIIKL